MQRAGRALIAAAFALSASLAAAANPLVVLVDTGTEMPLARFDDSKLVGGIHKDLGEALAARMGRAVTFKPLPRKRIAMALESGQADFICLYMPSWLPGRLYWSRGFFPISEVVVTDTSVAQPHQLKDLSGERIATILGYYYPELEAILGDGFIRDDGFSSSTNLRKMSIGRLHHAIVQQNILDYYLQIGEKLSLYPPLLIKRYLTQCAVAPHGQVSLDEFNKAASQLVKDGTITKIIDRYRPHAK